MPGLHVRAPAQWVALAPQTAALGWPLVPSLRYATRPAEVKAEGEYERRGPGVHGIEDERFVTGDVPDEQPEQRHHGAIIVALERSSRWREWRGPVP